MFIDGFYSLKIANNVIYIAYSILLFCHKSMYFNSFDGNLTLCVIDVFKLDFLLINLTFS